MLLFWSLLTFDIDAWVLLSHRVVMTNLACCKRLAPDLLPATYFLNNELHSALDQRRSQTCSRCCTITDCQSVVTTVSWASIVSPRENAIKLWHQYRCNRNHYSPMTLPAYYISIFVLVGNQEAWVSKTTQDSRLRASRKWFCTCLRPQKCGKYIYVVVCTNSSFFSSTHTRSPIHVSPTPRVLFISSI